MLKAKEKVKSFFISRPRHEIITLQLLIIAILLLACSFIPFGLSSGTGILQGVSTGIISGIVLLSVTAIKSRDSTDISKKYSEIISFLKILDDIDSIYADLYHDTYHGKKYAMGSQAYLDLMRSRLDKLSTLYRTLPAYPPKFSDFYVSANEISFYRTNMRKIELLIPEIQRFADFTDFLSSSNSENISKIDDLRRQFSNIPFFHISKLYRSYSAKAAELHDSLMAIHKSIV